MSKICVSVIEKSLPEVITSSVKCKSQGVDIVEVRLDYLNEPITQATLDALYDVKMNIDLPMIITLRPRWEGGKYTGEEADRLEILKMAIEKGFDYVDLEIKIQEDKRTPLIDHAQYMGIKTIISNHDFKGTPVKEEILDQIKECHSVNGDLAKVAYYCNSFDDIYNVLWAALIVKNLKMPYSIMGTGPKGHITRILAPFVGSHFVYSSLDSGKEATEGQIPIATLKGLWNILGI
jgi:3-dehydroquinate dehydratase/shikimate dehydrogenase